MPVVAVTDHVFPNLDPTERVLGGINAEMRLASAKTPEAILEVARDADGVIVCYADMTAEIIDQLANCKVLARTGIGYDNVDIAAASAKGMFVTNVPEYCEDEVSDHAMALLLGCVRKIAFLSESVDAGTWDAASAKPIGRLRGRTLGLAGFGKIPRRLSGKAQSFGIDVIAYDPYAPDEVFSGAGVRSVTFDELLADSDYISVHAPLTPETENMFGADAFAKMRQGSYIVNTARGPLIDVEALADALDSGHVAGAGLDVLPIEPPPAGSRLLNRPNVILTPHTGFYSEESMVDLQSKAAEQVVMVLSGQDPKFPVNLEQLRA